MNRKRANVYLFIAIRAYSNTKSKPYFELLHSPCNYAVSRYLTITQTDEGRVQRLRFHDKLLSSCSLFNIEPNKAVNAQKLITEVAHK